MEITLEKYRETSNYKTIRDLVKVVSILNIILTTYYEKVEIFTQKKMHHNFSILSKGFLSTRLSPKTDGNLLMSQDRNETY